MDFKSWRQEVCSCSKWVSERVSFVPKGELRVCLEIGQTDGVIIVSQNSNCWHQFRARRFKWCAPFEVNPMTISTHGPIRQLQLQLQLRVGLTDGDDKLAWPDIKLSKSCPKMRATMGFKWCRRLDRVHYTLANLIVEVARVHPLRAWCKQNCYS